MKVSDAVAKRVSDLLKEREMTLYRLETLSGIQHSHMQWIMGRRGHTVTLTTVIMLAKGFDMSLTEFLDDELFDPKNLDDV